MASCDKISFDFHGVISARPEFFSELTQCLKALGMTVYVVSGGPKEYIEKFLAAHNVAYDCLWCIFDYYNAQEKVAVSADGSFHIDDELWNAAKGKFCEREQIGLHIDDSRIYGKYFTTPYIWFDAKRSRLITNGRELWLDEGAAKMAEALLGLCAAT